MYKKVLTIVILSFILCASQVRSEGPLFPITHTDTVLSEHTMPMNDRYAVPSVSDVFKDNILLTISYLSGRTKQGDTVDWNTVRQDFTYKLTLQPGDVFAFHNDVLPEYAGKNVITANAHFSAGEGFESDGYLVGDGVCHLASLMNWVARDAGLKVIAPTNHDFAVIQNVSREYGTAIYYSPGQNATNEAQNLYIENTKDKPVTFVFTYKNNVLNLEVTEK
jgi:hypothetical protein